MDEKKTNIVDFLADRGYVAQSNKLDELKEYLSTPGRYFYVGFDPTADSLHVGHLVQLVAMRRLKMAGHKPIALLGGATGKVGDPSGRQDLRKVLSYEQVDHNVACIGKQIKKILDIKEGEGFICNNADWLDNLRYLDFLRDVGVCFSVNKMLTAECYKSRLEVGLTFLEFSYMLLQAYDFYHLFQEHGCRLQCGGNDQWSNLLAGADLIRRKEGEEAYVLTFNLLTTASGGKMGKSAQGAIWLDPDKCSPYNLYQYFRNCDDRDVIKFMNLLTLMPSEEINKYSQLEGQDLNKAKERLAFEICALVHSEEAAKEAEATAKKLFASTVNTEDLDKTPVSKAQLADLNLVDFLKDFKVVPSKSEGRRMIDQGGIYLNDQAATDPNAHLTEADFPDGVLTLRRGKKKFFLFSLEEN